MLFKLNFEQKMNLMIDAKDLLELGFGQLHLFWVLGLGVELHNSTIFVHHSFENPHFGGVIEHLYVHIFSWSLALLNHPLLNSMNLTSSVINLLLCLALGFLSLDNSSFDNIKTLFVGLFRVMEIQHLENVGIGSLENLLLRSTLHGLLNQLSRLLQPF